jgi:hypothetical protein
MADLKDTLAERGARYGMFDEHAGISQALQDTMRAAPGFARLAADQKQALATIADKIARVLNGDPDYVDNWHDIAGYAALVEQRLTGTGIYAARAAWNEDIARRTALMAAGLTNLAKSSD